MCAAVNQVHTCLPSSWLRGRERRKAENRVQDRQVILGLDNRAVGSKRTEVLFNTRARGPKERNLNEIEHSSFSI